MALNVKQRIKELERKHAEKHMPSKSGPDLSEDNWDNATKFLEDLEQSIVDGRDTSRNVEDDGFHPSSLGIKHGKCARRAVYLMQGVPKGGDIPPRLQRIFDNGHAVHERLQGYMERMGIDMVSEVKVATEEPPIRGHCDGTMRWNDTDYAVEIKSCNDMVFVNRVKFKKPKPEHIEQVNIYAHVLGIEKILVIYENKDTQELLIYEVDTDHEKAQKQIDKWHAQWLCLKAGELPKRPYKPSSPTCAQCDLKDYCFADDEVGVDIKPYSDKVKKLREEAEAEEAVAEGYGEF